MGGMSVHGDFGNAGFFDVQDLHGSAPRDPISIFFDIYLI
jgi:hypothetical protein